MKKAALSLCSITLCVMLFFPHSLVHAGQGLPGTVEFAYGAQLNTGGAWVQDALNLSASLQLDWLAIDFDWKSYYPSIDSDPDFSHLDELLDFTAKHQISVLLQLRSAPDWALTDNGPDPAASSALLSQLLGRYPGMIQAVELFSEPNTRAGWGANPDPQAYVNFFLKNQSALQKHTPHTLIMIGSLTPVTIPDQNNMDDLFFLQGLYQYGLKGHSKVIGIHLTGLNGTPSVAPKSSEDRVARHFEEIHQLMLQNQDDKSNIWVTKIQPPVELPPASQKEWLEQAYSLFKARLYIGAVFFHALNPENANSVHQPSLIQDEQNYHPFYSSLRNIIARNNPESALRNHGRTKENLLAKLRK